MSGDTEQSEASEESDTDSSEVDNSSDDSSLSRRARENKKLK